MGQDCSRSSGKGANTPQDGSVSERIPTFVAIVIKGRSEISGSNEITSKDMDISSVTAEDMVIDYDLPERCEHLANESRHVKLKVKVSTVHRRR